MQSLTVARSFIASQLDISWYFLGALSHRDIAWLRYSVIFLSQVKQIWQHLAATDTFLSQDDSIAPSLRAKLQFCRWFKPWFHGSMVQNWWVVFFEEIQDFLGKPTICIDLQVQNGSKPIVFPPIKIHHGPRRFPHRAVGVRCPQRLMWWSFLHGPS